MPAVTALLRWNGNGFDEIRFRLRRQTGSARLGSAVEPELSNRVGGPGGFTAGTLLGLSDGPFGHTQPGPQPDGTLTTADVTPAVVADFNNDGLPDIFATLYSTTNFTTGCPTANPCRFDLGDETYAVRLNQGARRFIDASPSPYVNLGRGVAYQNLIPVDINNDGFLGVVGIYTTTDYDVPPRTRPQWGTTFFLISPGRTEGIVFQSVGGCGTPGGCPADGLNLYKVGSNGALRTGPNFVDPATLGVPGFNEFFYLRHYPDAASAVQAGQYSSGLAHYLAVGRARGYLPSAASVNAPTNLTATVAGSAVTLSWSAPLTASVTSALIEAGSASGLSNLASFPTGSAPTSFSTSGVASGTYYVGVKAIRGTPTSGPSNEIVVTVR